MLAVVPHPGAQREPLLPPQLGVLGVHEHVAVVGLAEADARGELLEGTATQREHREPNTVVLSLVGGLPIRSQKRARCGALVVSFEDDLERTLQTIGRHARSVRARTTVSTTVIE